MLKALLVILATLVYRGILVIKDQLVYKGRPVIQDIKARPVPGHKAFQVIPVTLELQEYQVILVIKDQQELEPKVHLAIPVILDLQV